MNEQYKKNNDYFICLSCNIFFMTGRLMQQSLILPNIIFNLYLFPVAKSLFLSFLSESYTLFFSNFQFESTLFVCSLLHIPHYMYNGAK